MLKALPPMLILLQLRFSDPLHSPVIRNNLLCDCCYEWKKHKGWTQNADGRWNALEVKALLTKLKWKLYLQSAGEIKTCHGKLCLEPNLEWCSGWLATAETAASMRQENRSIMPPLWKQGENTKQTTPQIPTIPPPKKHLLVLVKVPQ